MQRLARRHAQADEARHKRQSAAANGRPRSKRVATPAVGAIEAAAALLGPRRAVVVDVLPWMTPAESMAATSSVVPGSAFETLNEAEARRIADRGAETARSAGFQAEPRGQLASSTWQGIVDVADELDVAVMVIGSRGLTGMKKVFDASLSQQVAEHAGRPVLIVPPER